MLELGTTENPLIVTCDVTEGRYRYIYIKVDDAQNAQIDALECVELDRLSPVEHTERGTNVHYGECKLRVVTKYRNLTGRKVICMVQPSAIRRVKGRYCVDLCATTVRVVGRVYCWCI